MGIHNLSEYAIMACQSSTRFCSTRFSDKTTHPKIRPEAIHSTFWDAVSMTQFLSMRPGSISSWTTFWQHLKSPLVIDIWISSLQPQATGRILEAVFFRGRPVTPGVWSGCQDRSFWERESAHQMASMAASSSGHRSWSDLWNHQPVEQETGAPGTWKLCCWVSNVIWMVTKPSKLLCRWVSCADVGGWYRVRYCFRDDGSRRSAWRDVSAWEKVWRLRKWSST